MHFVEPLFKSQPCDRSIVKPWRSAAALKPKHLIQTAIIVRGGHTKVVVALHARGCQDAKREKRDKARRLTVPRHVFRAHDDVIGVRRGREDMPPNRLEEA